MLCFHLVQFRTILSVKLNALKLFLISFQSKLTQVFLSPLKFPLTSKQSISSLLHLWISFSHDQAILDEPLSFHLLLVPSLTYPIYFQLFFHLEVYFHCRSQARMKEESCIRLTFSSRKTQQLHDLNLLTSQLQFSHGP